MKSTLALLSVLAFTAVLSINALPIPAPAPFSDKERSEIDALRLRGVPEADVYARMSTAHLNHDCGRGAEERGNYGCRQFVTENDYATELLGGAMFDRSQTKSGRLELRGVEEDLSRYEERRKRMIIPRGPAKRS